MSGCLECLRNFLLILHIVHSLPVVLMCNMLLLSVTLSQPMQNPSLYPGSTTSLDLLHAPTPFARSFRATPFTFNARNHPAPNSRALIRVLSLIARPRPTAHRPAPIGLLQHTIPITSPRNHCSTSSAPRYRSLTAPRITSARVSTATLPSDSSAKAPRYSWAPRPCF